MKEKRILTKKEWEEMQEMLEEGKRKRQAQEIIQKKKIKKLKLKRSIKNVLLVILTYIILTGMLLLAGNYIQGL